MPSDAADRARRRRLVIAAAIVAAIVLVDQLTKLWAVRALADAPVGLIGDTVEFRLARNTGGAFSLFQAFTPVLALVAIVVSYFLVRTVRRADDLLLVVALALVLGGALGNLLDRVFRSPGFLRGAVVDFVRLGGWPTFNLADAAITVGAVLVVVWSLVTSGRDDDGQAARPPVPQTGGRADA